MRPDIVSGLKKLVPSENVIENEPLKNHTSFRIGGPADVFVTLTGAETIIAAVGFCRENDVPYYILGNGTNVLAADEGFRGVVIKIGAGHDDIKVDGKTIKASAGALLAAAAAAACAAGLTGMEFASGIPGSLGGALIMNAGAYGGEIKDIISDVTLYSPDEGIMTVSGEEMNFGYRTSRVKGTDDIALACSITLSEGDPAEIKARMDELKALRTSKQPLEYPSAGSTFKRPEGYFAGKLIMDAGLKGFSIGGAQVSEKHCGFVINKGGATAEDVKRLTEYVIKTVDEKSGVVLEPEIVFLGQV